MMRTSSAMSGVGSTGIVSKSNSFRSNKLKTSMSEKKLLNDQHSVMEQTSWQTDSYEKGQWPTMSGKKRYKEKIYG